MLPLTPLSEANSPSCTCLLGNYMTLAGLVERVTFCSKPLSIVGTFSNSLLLYRLSIVLTAFPLINLLPSVLEVESIIQRPHNSILPAIDFVSLTKTTTPTTSPAFSPITTTPLPCLPLRSHPAVPCWIPSSNPSLTCRLTPTTRMPSPPQSSSMPPSP